MTDFVHPYLLLMRIKSWKELSYFSLLGILVSKTIMLVPASIVYVAVCIASSSIFAVNNIYDAPYDTSEEKRRKNPVTSGVIGKSRAILFVIFLLLLSLFLFSLVLRPFNMMLVIMGIALAYLYSAPPARFKEKPPLDTLFHGIIPSISFFFSYTTFAPLSCNALLFTLAVVILGSGMSLLHQLQDYDVDAHHNLATSATTFGKKRAALLVSILFAAGLLFLLYFSAVGFVTRFIAPLILLAFYVPTKIFLENEREDFVPLVRHLRKYINVIFFAIVLVLVADLIAGISSWTES